MLQNWFALHGFLLFFFLQYLDRTKGMILFSVRPRGSTTEGKEKKMMENDGHIEN